MGAVGQMRGKFEGKGKGGKTAILGEKRRFSRVDGVKREVKVVGLEPTTHGLKGRCSAD